MPRSRQHHACDHPEGGRTSGAHGHDGDHGGHSHAAGVSDERRVAWAFGIVLVFMVIEAAGGLVAGSLALLADAGHMVSDAAALAMTWAALRIGKRPADALRSYGYRRLEVLVAFLNGSALFVLAAWIVVEATRRLMEPAPILGGTMLIVAVAGLLANALAFFVLHGGNRQNLNIRSAWLHVLGDVLGFVVAIAAAAVILGTGWSPIDPILSVVVAVLILKSAAGIVRSSAHILLEGTPPGVDDQEMRADLLAAIPALADVHHIHVWSLTTEHAMVTLHARCAPGADPMGVIAAVNGRLKDRFGIDHSTIQIDDADCGDERCG
jgi:cobalt-zinc-cadmium efflux system protein